MAELSVSIKFKEWDLGSHKLQGPAIGLQSSPSEAWGFSIYLNFKRWNLGVSQLQDQVWFLATLLRSGIVPCVSLAARTSYIIAKKWNQGFHKEH